MDVEIRFCRADEVDRLMAFLRDHWSPNHVLAWHRPMLDFQHRDRVTGDYHFVIACAPGEDSLLGVLGVLPHRLHDPALTARGQNMVWPALWKVRDDVRITGFGLRLLHFLARNEPHQGLGFIGIVPAHRPIYAGLGFSISELQQHYRLHPDLAAPKLVLLPEKRPPDRPARGEATLEALDADTFWTAVGNWEPVADAGVFPVKSPRYLYNRFFNHPVYTYGMYMVRLGGRPAGLLVTRVVTQEGARAVRLLDFLGPAAVLGEMGTAIRTLIERHEAEYADFWSHGIAPEILARAGLVRLDPDGPIVVPNYFEPFERRNIPQLIACKLPEGVSLRVFRADGDKDRPGLLPRNGGNAP